MHLIGYFFDFILHLDVVLPQIVSQYHSLAYVLLFFVVFIETGLVVTPFLPGDSLIFASATLAASGTLDPVVIFPLFVCASILGDNTNYRIGHFLSDRVKRRQKIRFIKTEYLDRTHKFYEKHGGAAVIIAKFMPIIRTFSPFVAGVGSMTYRRFFLFDAIGGICWVTLFFAMGILFGRQPLVQKHFSVVVLAIIVISVMPAIVIFMKEKLGSRKNKNAQ